MTSKFTNFSKIIVATILAAATSCTCQLLDPIQQQEIDNLISNYYLPENNAPGLGLSIVKDGEVVYTQGYGLRDIDNGIPADNNTLFLIGSVSKSFTATLVVKTLFERFPELGESALDIPIANLLPNHNFTLIDRYRSTQTTFRDILSHKTGTVPEEIGTIVGAFENVSELLYRQRYAANIVPFRTNFLYDNGLISMAGELISAIAETPYLSMLDNLLAQIGMSSSTYLKASDDHDNMPNRALGYFLKDGSLQKFNSELHKRYIPMNAAGGILSSPNDMARYIMFHLNKGNVDGTQIVPEEAMLWLRRISNPLPTRWKTDESDRILNDAGYTLGLFQTILDGWESFSHGGYLPPFNSLLTMFPSLNFGVFTTTNGPGRLIANANHSNLLVDIYDILQNGERQKPVKMLLHGVEKNQEYTVGMEMHEIISKNTPYQQEEVVGFYGNGQEGELEIIQQENSEGELQLYMIYGEWGLAWLEEVSGQPGLYRVIWDTDIVHDFQAVGGNGDEMSLLYNSSNPSISFFYAEVPVLSGPYIKDENLNDLPPIPWDPNSC